MFRAKPYEVVTYAYDCEIERCKVRHRTKEAAERCHKILSERVPREVSAPARTAERNRKAHGALLMRIQGRTWKEIGEHYGRSTNVVIVWVHRMIYSARRTYSKYGWPVSAWPKYRTHGTDFPELRVKARA